MNYLIVSGGQTDRDFAYKVIKNGGFEVIIAADSGMDFLHSIEITPDVIVGDFDSADKDILEYYRQLEMVDIIMLNPEKDETDTESAIRFAIQNGADCITILGGTGSRIDHMLGNVCLLGIGLEERIDIFLLDKNNKIRMIDKELSIEKEKQFGKYVSLIPFGGNVEGLTLKGMKYPLDNYNMGGFNSLGISNEIVDDTALITFEKGVLLVIESRD